MANAIWFLMFVSFFTRLMRRLYPVQLLEKLNARRTIAPSGSMIVASWLRLAMLVPMMSFFSLTVLKHSYSNRKFFYAALRNKLFHPRFSRGGVFGTTKTNRLPPSKTAEAGFVVNSSHFHSAQRPIGTGPPGVRAGRWDGPTVLKCSVCGVSLPFCGQGRHCAVTGDGYGGDSGGISDSGINRQICR